MKIEINGKAEDVPERLGQVTLLSYLRDAAGLTGAKYGCGIGLCGACTVHVDGTAVRACQVSLEELDGARVTTIEGLAATAPGGGLHPVQEAWIAEAVPQCGYCQAGQIMSAAALLQHNPRPDAQEIRDGMSGNLCRCGTYVRIRRAVHRAAEEMQNG